MSLLSEHPQLRVNGAKPSWSDDRKKKLTELREQGLSSSQIGLKLGVTRNAVIGQAHRMGLAVPNRTVRAKVMTPRANPQRLQTHYTPRKRLRISLVETPGTPLTEPVYIPASEYDKSIPLEQRKTLLELNHHTCHWPIGDPSKPDFFFCGASTNRVYCQHHMIRAGRA